MSIETLAIRSYVTDGVSNHVQTHTLPNRSHMANVHTLVMRADGPGAFPKGQARHCSQSKVTVSSFDPHSTMRKALLGSWFH
jgi:hypothetical protein